jgi:ribosomal protein S18 acetylase RimI-like enzyme
MTTDNLHNLTSLWKTATLPFNSYQALPYFDYAYIEGCQWPNRLWFHQDLTKNSVLAAKSIVEKAPVQLTIPYFDIYNNKSFELLEKEGFQIALEQVAMFLKPKELFPQKSNFRLEKVATETQANLWASLFQQAFGYLISAETILRNRSYLSYYIAYNNEQAIGTGLTNVTHQTLGVHSVGVPPAMRRKGFAEEIMKHLINIALQDSLKNITLQASNMGKGLYLKLGFQEQFAIKSYRLKV